ncbi:TVP38/TMEM64 family inner membrane protein YdjZ [bacterium BMS3Bbin11]|nr:TVP38/TMEM64 family inner membrane protein YdjZ [bacterium BMS3Abin11]GBE46797.1 TVP38/TMEM64 family inner membrane protein YdjZ [bacterium BMS3Bbin11]
MESYGAIGPLIIILLMTIAILVSPLPSAPIAIAAGAAYGHLWGGLYVLTGSVTGATGAFLIARYLGYEYVEKIAKNHLPEKFINSQNALTGIVLLSRLMPFLSFDIISYAAGLTPLLLWRFLAATIIGILPASFFLAHVGSELATTELNRVALALAVLAGFTGLSFAVNFFRNKKSIKHRGKEK